MNPKNPLQKEAEAASIDSVMAEDHAVLLKSVKKSTLKAAFFKWLFTKSDPNLTGISQRLFCAHPAASKKSGAAKSSSDDENVPARTRKVTAHFLPRAFQKVTDDRKLCEELVDYECCMPVSFIANRFVFQGENGKEADDDKKGQGDGCLQSERVCQAVSAVFVSGGTTWTLCIPACLSWNTCVQCDSVKTHWCNASMMICWILQVQQEATGHSSQEHDGLFFTAGINPPHHSTLWPKVDTPALYWLANNHISCIPFVYLFYWDCAGRLSAN